MRRFCFYNVPNKQLRNKYLISYSLNLLRIAVQITESQSERVKREETAAAQSLAALACSQGKYFGVSSQQYNIQPPTSLQYSTAGAQFHTVTPPPSMSQKNIERTYTNKVRTLDTIMRYQVRICVKSCLSMNQRLPKKCLRRRGKPQVIGSKNYHLVSLS